MSNKQLIAVIAMGKLEGLYAQFPVILLSAPVVVGYRYRIYIYFD